MSHFTRIKTNLREIESLRAALRDLGYAFEEGAVRARGFAGDTAVDLVIRQPHGGYDIGFRKRGETYELVADWWGATIECDRFLDAVTQRYAYHTIVRKAQTQGFTLASDEKQPDGALRVVVQRWR
jgi:hypothetical protein